MRCLVTGAAGFIGNALVQRLASEGHDVVGLLHQTKPKVFNEHIDYIIGDITDLPSLISIVRNIDVVFHCAALVKDYGSKKLFYQINVEGTKNLVRACETASIRRFIYLSHLSSPPEKNRGYYATTKLVAEDYLRDRYERISFPVVILRPGNVYGPGATTWVLRVLEAIQQNRIAHIDHGEGIFLHTYIDNLIDAMVAAMTEPRAIGASIDVTDGDNATTWAMYLNALACMAGKPPITKNMSKNTAVLLSKTMMLLHHLFRIKPWITPLAIDIFTNKQSVSIETAQQLLHYQPKVPYAEGLQKVEQWLRREHYIPS